MTYTVSSGTLNPTQQLINLNRMNYDFPNFGFGRVDKRICLRKKSWECINWEYNNCSVLRCRLRDESTPVRKNTLLVLSHLILNDMIKVKGQISEMATCIIDDNAQIAGLARVFFTDLAKRVWLGRSVLARDTFTVICIDRHRMLFY